MSLPPSISASEWEIMRALWQKSPLTSAELQARTGMHLQTTKTYIGRLVKKGAVDYEKSGRSFLYRPLFSEAECQKRESRSFLDRVFGGSLHPMLSHLVEEEAISDDEVARLRKILSKRKKRRS